MASAAKRLSKWHQCFVNNVFFLGGGGKKIQILYILKYTICLQISPACGPNTYQTMCGEISSNVRICNGCTEKFYCQFYCKIDFPVGHSTLP